MKNSSIRLDDRKKFFTLKVVMHWKRFPREAGDPFPGNVPHQLGWSFELHGLEEDVPVHARVVERDDF